MGDGIGGPVIKCVSGNAFELDVTHFRKDNKEQYSKIEKIIISKIDNPDNPEYQETTQIELEQALKGKFVSCNVQYRDEKTDALVCNVFVQKPPEDSKTTFQAKHTKNRTFFLPGHDLLHLHCWEQCRSWISIQFNLYN